MINNFSSSDSSV